LLAVVAATSSACGAENDEAPGDDASSGGEAGEPSATGGNSGSAGTSSGGATAAGGTTTGGSAGASGANGGNAGSSGTSSGGSGGTSGGAGGGGGTGGTSGSGTTNCDDPLVSEDISRLETTDAVETYEVVGHSGNEIRTSMNASRPGDYDGLTTWNVRWSFQNCASPVWSVSLDIVYTMPDWEADASDEIPLVDAFSTYLDALYCHEYGHGRLAVQCANEIYDAVDGIPGSSDCTALQTTTTATVSAILDECNARDVTYDAETNHGATMGAVFPP
jgi:predicted secreted Zn-dependent protease